MGTRAFIGFRDKKGEVFVTAVQFDGGYEWLGADALQAYIQTEPAELQSLFEQTRWVDFPFTKEEEFTDEAQLFLAKYNRKGRVLLDILKTKSVEKANTLQEGNVMDYFVPDHLKGKSNIEQLESGEWVATFLRSMDIADDHFMYGYLYDLKEDTFEIYSLKSNELDTIQPVFSKPEYRLQLTRTLSIKRDWSNRKLLKLLRHADQISEWYKEQTGKNYADTIWEENMIQEMDFLLKNVVKEKDKERKVYRIPLPIKENEE